jgi:hypothetical protein
MLGGVHYDDEAKVYKQLCAAVEEWIEIYENDGDPLPAATSKKDYSGKFNLRVGKELHEQIVINALKRGESLNKFWVETIKKKSDFNKSFNTTGCYLAERRKEIFNG